MTPLLIPGQQTSSNPPEIIYPERDGKPMSDNTRQAHWILLLYANLMAIFPDQIDVFIAADLLWYPIERDNQTRIAPNVMVVVGRPRGHRGSYRQWEEGGVPVTVAFEILSPSNDQQEMADKFLFYEQHGVEEYYVYDPDRNSLEIYTRGVTGSALVRVRDLVNYTSKRLGIRFEMTSPEMTVFGPDGKRFKPPAELVVQAEKAETRAEEAETRVEEEKARAEREKARAEEEKARAEIEKARAEREKARAEEEKARAEIEKARADEAQSRAEEVKAQVDRERTWRVRIGELSRKARQGQASPEELQELDRLESQP